MEDIVIDRRLLYNDNKINKYVLLLLLCLFVYVLLYL